MLHARALLALIPAVWAGLIAWLVLRILRPVRSQSYGDFTFDSLAGINRILSGNALAVYGGDERPLMLPFSLLVEAPVVALTRWGDLGWWWGADEDIGRGMRADGPGIGDSFSLATQADYLAASWAAMTAAAMLVGYGVWRLGRPAWQRTILSAATIIILLANPLSLSAVRWGHPEELLMTGALAAAGLWLWQGRPRAAAVCLGLALATKQPAVLAFLPLLLAVPRGRRLGFSGWALGTTLIVSVPPALLSMSEFLAFNTRPVTSTDNSAFSPFSIAHHLGGAPWLVAHGKHMVLVIAVVLPLVLAWRRGWALNAGSALALMSALFVIRDILDPWNIIYYATPALAGVLVLELVATPLRWRYAPLGTLCVSVLLAVGHEHWNIFGATTLSPYRMSVGIYILLALALLALALRLDPLAAFAHGERARLYAALTALAAVAGLIWWASNEATPSRQERARDGLLALRASYPEYATWLGARPLAGARLDTARALSPLNPLVEVRPGVPSALTQVSYVNDARAQTLSIIAAPANLTSALMGWRNCRAGRCPRGARMVRTARGPGMLDAGRGPRRSGETRLWTLTMRASDGSALVLSGIGIDAWQPYVPFIAPMRSASRAELMSAVTAARAR